MLHKIIVSFSLFIALIIFSSASATAGDVVNSAEIINQLIPITGDEGRVVERHLDLDIQFQRGAYKLDKESVLQVIQLANALSSPQLEDATFKIIGHTDATGNEDQNKKLSIKRAQLVTEILIVEFDFDAERFETLGVGQSQLKDTSNPNSAENRRVEIIAVHQPSKIETLGDGGISIIE